MSDVLNFFSSNYLELFALAGMASVLAGGVARLTPNKADDAAVAKAQRVLEWVGSLFLKPRAK